MDDKQEEIRQLVFKEILGTITVAEKELLYAELDRNPMAKKMWEEMNTPEVREYLGRNSAADFAERVLDKVRDHRSRSIWKGVAVAAIMFGFIGGTVWLLGGKKQESISLNKVQLLLPGGERVALEEARGDVSAGGVRINNSHKRMSYQTAAELNNQFAVLYVPSGKDYTITLSDGTVVQLNAASKLRFPLNFGNQSREIFVEGEAYLEVKKDAKRPFTVHLPASNIQVLGTAFNVNTYDNKKEKVALVEGAVRLVSKQDSVLLNPGEEAVADGQIRVERFDEYETLSWREGKFVMNNVRMADVCKVIPRLFGVEMTMDNKEVGEKRFSGLIDRNRPVEELMKGLTATNGIDYYWQDGVVHIR